MKFLNKKEQVLDTLLTPHGEKLLADGLLKPEYYAFFDDNVLYESLYTDSSNTTDAAIAAWTFTDKGNEETTITLTDSGGTSVVFEIDQAGNGLADAGSGNTLLTGFANSAAGMAGVVIAAVNASVLNITATTGGGSTGEVLLTQDIKGTVGNTAITLSDYNNWNANTTGIFPTTFTGGTDLPGEGQNNIEPRIQEDTPQLETQVVFSDRNIYRSKTGDAPAVLEEVAQDIDTIIDLTKQNSSFERHFYGPRHPLGTTEKFTSNAPAWSVSLLRGQIDSHADHELNDTEPTLAIAQLDVTLNYNIDVISDPTFVSDTQLAITFPNGEILDVEPEIILAQIKELNTEFTKDNFEIEVFEVTEETVPGGHSLGPKDVEVLRPLKFIRQPSLVQNDILLDEDEIVSIARTPTPDNVEYYFDIRVDGQIDERLICSSVAENEKQGRYIDIDFECEDTTNIALVDIYSTAASSKPCPDLDDPCEDEPGTVY